MTRLILIFLFLVVIYPIIHAQNNRITIEQFFISHSEELGFADPDIANWKISSEQFSKHNEVNHVYIQQQYNDVDILNAIGSFAILKNGKTILAGDALVRNIERKINILVPLITESDAISMAQTKIEGDINLESIGLQKIYFLNQEDQLRLSFLVYFESIDKQHFWFNVIDANDASLLHQWDQVMHCDFGTTGFSVGHADNNELQNLPDRSYRSNTSAVYNVFKIPVESPNHGVRSTISGLEDIIASPFGWHDTNAQNGPEFTTTKGNNVSAYDDSNNSNSEGYAPNGGPDLIFDFPIDPTAEPSVSRDAAITNLFYMNNFMHDFSYQYGFDEASGNFQKNNYGNGGSNNDYVLAEALDGSGTNNANFSTLWDGVKPRMQMYIWTNNSSSEEFLFVNTPDSLAHGYSVSTAAFGVPISETPLTSDVLIYTDDTAPFNDACQPATNANNLSGKIAILDRGDCTFVSKVRSAQNAGAIAVIIVNNVQGPPISMGGIDLLITIPVVMMSLQDGLLIKTALNNGAVVNVTLVNNNTEPEPNKDGDYDNGIIAHEYTHGISTRLVGGRFNPFCLGNQEQMGEGWSDYFALMATIDINALNPIRRPIGTYVTNESSTEGFGIRPVPYDTSFVVNAYTYADLNNDEISVPHGVGFIWCTMLWDLTWALIDKYGYDPNTFTGTGGNNLALQLITDGLKLVNCSPGFVNGRDAILQADEINNNGDNQCLIWSVFARRGLGFSASQGNANQVNDGIAAYDTPTSCNDISDLTAFSADNTTICNGEVQFTDESNVVSNEWLWDFGDGQTSTDQNPLHVYEESGTYSVSLNIAGDNGFGSSTIESYITVNYPEVPSNAIAQAGCIGDSLLLTATTSSGTIVWTDEFQNIIGTGSSTYSPSLMETTQYNVYSQIIISGDTCNSDEVNVEAVISNAQYSIQIDGLEVNFTDESDGAIEWLWDFGDNTSSTDQNPVHLYNQNGTYEVTLSINDGQCSVSQTVSLEVTGLQENLNESLITIIPNPTSSFAEISFSEPFSDPITIKAFDSEGKEMNMKLQNIQTNNYQLDLREWPSGHYIIQVVSKSWKKQHSLVVTKN